MHTVGIAGAKQKIVTAVPDDQREEALDTVEQPFSPIQVCIEDERRIGRCGPSESGEVVEPLAARMKQPVEEDRAVAFAGGAVGRTGTRADLEPPPAFSLECGKPGAG